jgi:hypothetical protein
MGLVAAGESREAVGRVVGRGLTRCGG